MIQRTTLLLAAWLVLNGTASAGGVYLPRSGTAASTSQRAVLVLEGNTTTMLLQSGFSGTATDLAWVVPITGIGGAQEMGLGTADVFERLHEETAPQLVRVIEKRKQLGCSSEGKTFATPTNIPPFNGLSAAGTKFFPLDGPLSANATEWLTNAYAGDVCRDNATSCTVDEDCGEPTVCQWDVECYDFGNPPNWGAEQTHGCCMNEFEQCATDADCNADVECFQSMCVNLTPTCGDDTDCGGEITCRGGFCKQLTPICRNDTDCDGFIEQAGDCDVGMCTDRATACKTDEDCPDDETCGVCKQGTENARSPCTEDAACGTQQCVADTCFDGSSCTTDENCGGLTECVGGECQFDTSSTPWPCDDDVDCAGFIECIDGFCEHGGDPCDDNLDCGGVDECAAHCENLMVTCTEDAECDMVCEGNLCKTADGSQETKVSCSQDDDCAADDECKTHTVNGSDLTLCENLAADCTTDADCNTECRQYPFGSGEYFCDGGDSVIPCPGLDQDQLCRARTECQQGICVNQTPSCTSDINCNVTTGCDLSSPYAFGLICETDDDCRSGQCLRHEGVFVCSRSCDLVAQDCPDPSADIPAGFDCVQSTGNTTLCWPRSGPVPPGRCAGSDFRCFDDADCRAQTECQ